MATGKKSFVLYTSYVHAINLLTDEQAGKLLKHIFNYVNDLDPKEDDVLVRIAFEPIKQQLKRDLVKWKSERKSRSKAGKKGMKSRWGKAITNDNTAITKDNSVINGITKITDNVDVNVNVDVNENVILYRIEECLQFSLNDERWVRANKTNREELNVFNSYLEQVSEYTKNPKDYKSHFARFKRKYPDKLKAESKPLSIEEFRRLAKEQDKISAA